MASIFIFTHPDTMGWLAVLLGAAVKGLAILSAAAAAAWLLRGRSAALRHTIWSLSAAALLCVPVLSMVMPQLRVPLLPGGVGPEMQPAEAPAPPLRLDRAIADGPAGALESRGLPGKSEPLPPQPAPAGLAATDRPAARQRLHWPGWVLSGWAAGAVLTALPLLVGTAAVWRMVRRADSVDDNDWLAILEDLRRSLGLRRPVKLLRSVRTKIPLTCGVIRPTIVLPSDADAWPADRRRVVLLHELAHVKRADCLTQFLARLASVLHWFNPLAHLAAGMLRIERERACDDLVLAAGHKPSDYALHLLEIVRSLRSARRPSLAAVAMAGRSQLEGRVQAILDERRSRGALTRLGALVACVLAACLVAPLSAVNATAAGDEPSARAASAPGSEGATAQPAKPAADEDASQGLPGQRVEMMLSQSRQWPTTMPDTKAGAGAVTMSGFATQTSTTVPKWSKEEGREIDELIAQRKYKLLRTYEHRNGEPVYVCQFTLAGGKTVEIKFFAIPPDKVESMVDYKRKVEQYWQEREEAIQQAIAKGNYRLIDVEPLLVHVCRDVRTGKKIDVQKIVKLDGSAIAFITEPPLPDVGRAVAHRTTWDEHLKAVREGARELLDVRIVKSYSYEVELADGTKAIFNYGGQVPLEKMVAPGPCARPAKDEPDNPAAVAEAFLQAIAAGSDEKAKELILGDTVQTAGFPKLREFYDLAGVRIEKVLVSSQDACIVISALRARKGDREMTMGLGLRKENGHWLVRDVDALPTAKSVEEFVESFKQAFPDAAGVPGPKAPAQPDGGR